MDYYFTFWDKYMVFDLFWSEFSCLQSNRMYFYVANEKLR